MWEGNCDSSAIITFEFLSYPQFFRGKPAGRRERNPEPSVDEVMSTLTKTPPPPPDRRRPPSHQG